MDEPVFRLVILTCVHETPPKAYSEKIIIITLWNDIILYCFSYYFLFLFVIWYSCYSFPHCLSWCHIWILFPLMLSFVFSSFYDLAFLPLYCYVSASCCYLVLGSHFSFSNCPCLLDLLFPLTVSSSPPVFPVSCLYSPSLLPWPRVMYPFSVRLLPLDPWHVALPILSLVGSVHTVCVKILT